VAARGSRLHQYGSFLGRGTLLLAGLFPEREIVLRTGLRRRCFTLSTGLQAVVALAAAGTAIWQGVVTTQWVFSAAVIALKDYEIVDLRVAAIRSRNSSESRFRTLAADISSEVEEIQRNLALIARHDSMTSKPIAAYTQLSGEAPTKRGTLEETLDGKLARLEQSLRSLRSGHAELLATSAQTASTQLDRIESALATAGIDAGALMADTLRIAADSPTERGACVGEGLSCGGPFVREIPTQAMNATMQRWDDLVVAMSRV
jgi:hypothetical protein